VPDAGEVHVDHVPPDLLVHLVGGREAGDAGVAAHDVEPPELGHALVEGGLERAVVAHVGLGGDDPPVQRFHLLDRLGQVVGGGHRDGDRLDLLADVDGDDVGALLGEPDRVAAALPSGGSGDERDLPFDPSHYPASFGVWRVACDQNWVLPASTASVWAVT
jgi:hypothetical protein